MLRGAVRWMERGMLLAAMICLAWVYGAWKNAAFYQLNARRQIAEMPPVAPAPDPLAMPVAAASSLRDGGLIGVLESSRLGLSVVLIDGDDAASLRLAAGHVTGTPLPWEAGNAAFAGHRDTFFRPLEHLRVGDALSLNTRHGRFRYRVLRTIVVEPRDLWVLNPPDAVDLTLITCYPFTYVGPAPQRFVVHASQIEDPK